MAPLNEPGASPTVLLTLATMGLSPKAHRVGKVIRAPDPTIVLMVPATRPTATMARASSADMGRVYQLPGPVPGPAPLTIAQGSVYNGLRPGSGGQARWRGLACFEGCGEGLRRDGHSGS